jgi:lantibiotic modifying enzyme
VAAAAVGAAVGKAQYLEAAAQMGVGISCPVARGEFDIISGRAGAIFGLLWLSARLGDAQFREEAQRLAWELAEAAERSGDAGSAASWAAEPRTGAGNLTGFSHGASGAACALLEVAAITRQAELATVAEQAFSYERSLFDPEVRNWPDLRTGHGAVTDRRGPSSYPVAWCHGAAGIGLARLRAYELTGLPVLKHEAEVALETTSAHTEAALRAGTGSYALCHGLAGNAEILETGYRILGSPREKWRDRAREVASSGIERFGHPGKAWPCGTHEGETPGLMLGLAGTGMFYLRLHKPTIGSALLLSLSPRN